MTAQQTLPAGKYRLTVDDYLRLDANGVFGTQYTELLDGDVIVMNAEYRPHGWVRDELTYRLRQRLEDLNSHLTAMGGSVHLSGHDMPMPDIVLTSEPRGEGAIPVASVALVVEVSSTTLQRDMAQKLALYARARIAEYWIADVAARIVHQFAGPVDDGYDRRQAVAFGEPLSALTIAELSVDSGTL